MRREIYTYQAQVKTFQNRVKQICGFWSRENRCLSLDFYSNDQIVLIFCFCFLRGIVHPKRLFWGTIDFHIRKKYIYYGMEGNYDRISLFFGWTMLLKTQLLASQDVKKELCGILVDYCDVPISCLDSHSDGTHSMQWIHWWIGDVMLHFSTSVPMKKQTHLHFGWPEVEYIFSNTRPHIKLTEQF